MILKEKERKKLLYRASVVMKKILKSEYNFKVLMSYNGQLTVDVFTTPEGSIWCFIENEVTMKNIDSKMENIRGREYLKDKIYEHKTER